MERTEQRTYDVIVAGGGPAGVAAAVAAARTGSRTLLIEREPFLGGMATLACVPAFGPYTDGTMDLIGGIGREILDKLKKECYKSPFFDRKPDRIEGLDWHPIDPEILKRVLDRLVKESGCDALFHTVVTGADVRDGCVEAVRVFHKGGQERIEGDYFIDCTGDGDLAVMSGASWEYGDAKGQVQSGTLCFRVSGVDTERFMEYAGKEGEDGNLTVAVEKAKREGRFPKDETKVCGIALQADGVAGLNFGHVYELQPLNPWNLTEAEMAAREKLPELVGFLREYVPGMGQCVLVGSGPYLGVRESRRICGRYTLTAKDYENRADFPDSIAYYSYPMDIHPAVPEDGAEKEALYRDSKYEKGECYGIPYRCLLPKGLKNLAVAGRIISADRAMQSSVRIMGPCFATGQAAGTAAALSVAGTSDSCGVSGREEAGKPSLDQLDVQLLRKSLKEQKVYLK